MSAAVKSVPETELKIQKLKDYFESQADGDELSWMRIESDTGVTMDYRGKGLARSALRKLRRPYEALRGHGLKMSSPDSAITIMGGKFVRIDAAVRRADRTRACLQDRHLVQMSHKDQAKMLALAGFFGAVRAFASEAGQRLKG